MREILFRGKNTNGEWVEGFVGATFTADENRKPILRNFIEIDCLGWTSHTYVYDETVGQYTGLTDKNGKEIFEGDIVNVWWSDKAGEPHCCENYLIDDIRTTSVNGWLEFANKLEIIGNIHDNPELLKGGAE